MRVDHQRGAVLVEILQGPEKGRKKWIASIDAREQIANGDVRLVEVDPPKASDDEKEQESLASLRGRAEALGIVILGKSRESLEKEIRAKDSSGKPPIRIPGKV